MKITFTHAGVERTLTKHPKVVAKLKTGALTENIAAQFPWYIRLRLGADSKQKPFKLKALKESEVIREAKDLLKGKVDSPNEWAEFRQTKDALKSITVGELASAWFDTKLAFSRKHVRTPEAAAQLRSTVERALPWWRNKPVASITHGTHDEYVVARRQNVRKGFDGSRSADLEMAALSSMCQWAVKTERLKSNPFEKRERSVNSATIKHCHLAMAGNDEQLHSILSYFFSEPVGRVRGSVEQRIIVGAWFAFSALTGLRPGEHAFLQRVPAATAFPPDLRTAPYGLIYPMPDGSRRMKVFRLKGGQNPSAVIHPALQDFLSHYLPWLDAAQPATDEAFKPLFPGIEGEGKLNAYLRRACAAAKMPKMKPHGFGRAYYVRVRRSQGIDDSAIAAELGQKSDGALIRSVYGDPMDPVGGNLHDWLPKHGVVAWHSLTETALSNIISL